ncbi:MAG: hypothetical protein WCH84_01540, partial [Verrucomicrobiota bacterium]
MFLFYAAGKMMETFKQKKLSGTVPLRGLQFKSAIRAVVWASLVVAVAAPVLAVSIKFETPPAVGVALVSDAGAPGGQYAAVNIQEQRGAVVLIFQWTAAAPGFYRVSLPLRLHSPTEFNSAELQLRIEFGDTNSVWLAAPVAPTKLDGTPNTWT